jgi:hypothetical protein
VTTAPTPPAARAAPTAEALASAAPVLVATGATATPSTTAAPLLAAPGAATPSPATSGSPRTLAGELAALDAARAALAAGDARRALAGADAYDRDYPHGVLAQEAAVVRIEALHALGDDARARRLARAFLDAHPSTAHADRLRTILGSPP